MTKHSPTPDGNAPLTTHWAPESTCDDQDQVTSRWGVPPRDDDDVPFGGFGTSQIRTWRAQECFLDEFAVTRTKTGAGRRSGVHRETARLWERDDVFGFRERLQRAGDAFRDALEEHALSIVRQLGPTNSPLLLITLLNRHLPEVYRTNVVMVDETPKDLLKELRNLTRTSRPRRKPTAEPGDSEAVESVESLLSARAGTSEDA